MLEVVAAVGMSEIDRIGGGGLVRGAEVGSSGEVGGEGESRGSCSSGDDMAAGRRCQKR